MFRDGLTPLVKSSLRNKWQRIPRENCFYYRSAAHQGHYVFSFAFAFDKEEEIYQFALGYPYSYSRLQTYLQILEQKYPGNFERFSLGNSIVSTYYNYSLGLLNEYTKFLAAKSSLRTNHN